MHHNNNYPSATMTPDPKTSHLFDLKKLEKDITDRMRTFGNTTFRITQDDDRFLASLLGKHDAGLIYDCFFFWSEKPSAKGKPDLRYFRQDYSVHMGKAEALKIEKQAADKRDEAEHCPVCHRLFNSGECFTRGCSNNGGRIDSQDHPEFQKGAEKLRTLSLNIDKPDFRARVLRR